MDIEKVISQYETSLAAQPRLSDNTIHFYVNHLRIFCRHAQLTRLEELDGERIEAFFALLKRLGRRHSYMNIHYRSLMRFCNWVRKRPALAAHLPEENPMSLIERVPPNYGRPLPLTLQDVQAMLYAVKKHSRQPLRDASILSMFFDTGMRRGELATLRFSGIDWKGCEIQCEGKMGARTVYTSRQNLRLLRRYIREERKEAPGAHDIVFTGRHGRRLHPDSFTKLVRRIAIQAGVQEGDRRYIGPHALRHGFAITYLENGADEFHLQKAMGHTTTAMTSRYVNRMDKEMARVHQTFSPLDKLKRLQ